jgi:23S rRNA pseudouridine2605 synthase
MRLNRYLALCGYGSRRGCDEIIRGGRVKLNGEVVEQLAVAVEEGDILEVDGAVVQAPASYSTYILNKPPGYLCTRTDPEGRQTIFKILPESLKNHTYVGRLDLQSRGLVLISNDGELVHRLTHPKYEIPRKYAVWLHEELRDDAVRRIERGLVLEDGEELLPAKVKRKERLVELTLREGKNREIRRMMETLGYEVRDLKRVEYAGISMEGLGQGQYRELTPEELGVLYLKVGLQ